jgi:hypothetical protein
MKYETITFEITGETSKHIQIAREDGSFESFPVDENNPRYQQFLAETAEEKPKTKTKTKDK